jgi:uncharacterized protein YjbI with pentapeptide repeats
MSVTEELIALLQKGDIDGFNEMRRNRGRIEMFAVDLSGLTLTGADLSGIVMEKADLSGADLTDTILARTDLSGADLSETRLTGAMAIQIRLRDAWIEDTVFDEADLSQADFGDAELHRCSFREAVLTKARFKRANLVGCDFTDVEASEAKFSGATTEGCRFVRSQFRETSFKGTVLKGADLSGSEFPQARLREANLSGATFGGASFTSADLTQVVLTGADLTDADFRRADLTGVDFTGIDLEEAILTEAEIATEHQVLAWLHVPDLGPALLQDAHWACNGTHVAAVWMDTDDEGHGWVRVGVSPVAGPGIITAPVLPVPAELVLATAITATTTGFSVFCIVERPGGTATWLFPIDHESRLGVSQRIGLPYRPMVRPLLAAAPDGGVDIFGLGGQPSVLSVLRASPGEGLVSIHTAAARTARGFSSDHHPVLLTKGGTLDLVVPGHSSRPVSAPGDFPGRSCAAIPVDPSRPDGGLVMVWVPSSGRGLCVCVVVPGQQPDIQTIDRKIAVGRVDGAISGPGAWAVFTRPDVDRPRALSAWAMRLPDGKPMLVAADAERSARAVSIMPNPVVAVAVVSWDDGSATVVRLDESGSSALWSV